jgi:hypothetical protein
VELLSFGHRQFAFCYAVAKINLRRHYGHALLLGLHQKPVDLAPLDQEFSFSKRIVVAKPAGQILRNMAVYQPSLSGANFSIGVPQSSLALAKCFYLRADKYQARFQTIEQMIVIGSGSILRNNLHPFVLRLVGVRFHANHDSRRKQRAASRRFGPVSRARARFSRCFKRISQLIRLIYLRSTTRTISCCIL